ncbi:SCP2 sterol-binding domain-containing protein [Cobetia sp. L2A1]|uniref:SCP2 sterol-binding domain-containing protein n=1 Tax=Cobetia sp. L2A1 TaxID=2686360 RepID=UPI00131CB9B2|nr:SCP2 sterol-binding domain-containing protein [Cobetia sp. L2A1]
MATANAVIDMLKNRFNPEAAKGMDEVFQFNITDSDDYHMIIKDGTLDVAEGEHDDPSVTLSTDSETLKGVMKGEVDGMQAFMTGRLKATGNIMLATKLTSLFPNN